MLDMTFLQSSRIEIFRRRKMFEISGSVKKHHGGTKFDAEFEQQIIQAM